MTFSKLETLENRFINWKFTVNNCVTNKLIVENFVNCDIEDMFLVIKELSSLYEDMNFAFEIKSQGEFKIQLQEKKKRTKYKRMYTSGCFDIFHFGHLNILKKSKELCDYLIVGVSTDELILKEKGELPVIPFSERFSLVESIKYVDEVIPQVDKNKQKIIDDYAIDAISVGDDWRGRYPETSCPVEYFSYTENVSSTILKKTLNLR